jgi:hypothetical protein
MTEKEGMKEKEAALRPDPGQKTALKKITTAGWGIFFIWLGLVFMFDLGIGAVLLGVGLISLGTQAARKYHGLESEGFWIVVAVVFIIVGSSALMGTRLPLIAILLIVMGGAFIVSAVKSK